MKKRWIHPCNKTDCIAYGPWLFLEGNKKYPALLSRKIYEEKRFWLGDISVDSRKICPLCKHFKSFDLFVKKENENGSTLDTDT